MKKIIINDKEYVIKNTKFKVLKGLSRLGITPRMLENGEDNIFEILSALVAYNCDVSIDEADDMLDIHLEREGNLDSLLPLIETLQQSDFSQHQTAKK